MKADKNCAMFRNVNFVGNNLTSTFWKLLLLFWLLLSLFIFTRLDVCKSPLIKVNGFGLTPSIGACHVIYAFSVKNHFYQKTWKSTSQLTFSLIIHSHKLLNHNSSIFIVQVRTIYLFKLRLQGKVGRNWLQFLKLFQCR